MSGAVVTVQWVKDNEAFLIQLVIDALGVNGEYVQVTIGSIKESSSGIRLLQSGVDIEFLMSITEPNEYNLLSSSVESGSFATEFNQGLSENYGDDAALEADSLVVENQGTGDGDVFFGKEEETFGELLTSPFILLGVVCSMIGIVWLLFLRTNITSKYPSFKSPPPSVSGNNTAVEMGAMKPTTSTEPLVPTAGKEEQADF